MQYSFHMSIVLPAAMFLVEGECVCVSAAPNRLTETDEFFLRSQLFLFLFLIAISCFSLLIHLLHLLF